MSVISNAFKCMGYFSYVHLKKKKKKTGFASYYLNKQEVLVSSLYVLLENS